MTPTEITQRFTDDGYVVLPGFLDEATNVALRAETARHFGHRLGASTPPAAKDLTGCDVMSWNPLGEGNPVFMALAARPALLAVTAACIGVGASSLHSLVMVSELGGRGQAWHQDGRSDRPGAFNLNRLFYPSDLAAEDGAVVVVPGSHRRGRIPAGDPHGHFPDELELLPRAGTLVLLHGWCWHRVTANRSQRPRVSVNLRAIPAACATDVCDIGVYRNHEVDFRRGETIPARG